MERGIPVRDAPDPVVANKVPEVGKVTAVVPVIVNVEANAPEVVRFPPRVMVFPELFTPVPPFTPASRPVIFVERSIEPASILFVTLPDPMVVARLPAIVVISPVNAGN